MPAAGHLVHMPTHVMLRVGRYQDAAETLRAVDARQEGRPHQGFAVTRLWTWTSIHGLPCRHTVPAPDGARALGIAVADDLDQGIQGVDGCEYAEKPALLVIDDGAADLLLGHGVGHFVQWRGGCHGQRISCHDV